MRSTCAGSSTHCHQQSFTRPRAVLGPMGLQAAGWVPLLVSRRPNSELVTATRTRDATGDMSGLKSRRSRISAVPPRLSDATDAPIVTVTANSAAAIGNAVYDALGISVRTLPLSPENITAAMPD